MTPQDILDFWYEDMTPEEWFSVSETRDAEITRRFGALWETAASGGLTRWLASPRATLAYVIVTDQFPRNMHRGSPRSFETDPKARAAAKSALLRRLDARLSQSERYFLYMPLMHSETLPDQDRCVRLMQLRVPDNAPALLHARAHREVIRRFGRFPFRNEALGRVTTDAERAFMEAGAYGAVVREMDAAA
ncbi:DUF924 family protein [Histidinibacterium lentulum]|uniref:DUF924 domain-containing protein n=1 Tax=Histidinibacterium lentulum TaxID=2480588 RepID=A0A3N2R9Q2_9RHOB|nr:DUF924 family protein [Histidinibacterium lentulum]ROU04148.1 DUF924 domain-containing protein [Histidinibacterium lentulum]